MKSKLSKILCLFAVFLIGCTLVPTQHGVAQFWGDYTNFKFSDGSVKLSASAMIHSTVVRAHWHGVVLVGDEAVSSAIPGVGVGTRAAAATVPSLVSGFTQPPKSTPIPAH